MNKAIFCKMQKESTLSLLGKLHWLTIRNFYGKGELDRYLATIIIITRRAGDPCSYSDAVRAFDGISSDTVITIPKSWRWLEDLEVEATSHSNILNEVVVK